VNGYVVAAEGARWAKTWTEDFNDGQIIPGVRIENPLGKRASEGMTPESE